MVIHDPGQLPDGVCDTCAGSGYDPDEFHDIYPELGQLDTPCPDCHGTGEDRKEG